MDRALVRHEITSDGSSTLFSETFGVSYHSVHGAVQESEHVFIDAGLKEAIKNKSSLRILEVGLGTGLNALLTWKYTTHNEFKVDYTALEAFPISLEDAMHLDYNAFSLPAKPDDLIRLSWEQPIALSERFTFTKVSAKWPDYDSLQGYDLIYYDAFAPNAQPEMWQTDALSRSVELLNTGGIWVSYCAKGDVRRTLEALGLLVERLPGPPFKRHMLRARKA
jgi:tRNA U34 5-methylaminomethyl-2-thiouridine-forming methyltransferase MnmC